MKIQASAENYLEIIFVLQNRKGSVRAVDVATELGYTKPSVSRAVKLLRENGYITVASGGEISLTASGLEIAMQMYERHTLLTEFLIRIGVDETRAAEDACRIEHVISQETFERLKAFIESK